MTRQIAWHKQLLIISGAIWLSACSGGAPLVFNASPQTKPTAQVTRLPSLYVTSLNVSVPRNLIVSEQNGYRPTADIVWRGETYGDRYEQVRSIFEEGMGQSVDQLKGNLPITVNIEVTRFHALTEKTRYLTGGVHSISFNLTVLNAETGDVIVPAYEVHADIRGYGGKEALRAESLGQTQRVRIVEHLSNVISSHLSGVQYKPPK